MDPSAGHVVRSGLGDRALPHFAIFAGRGRIRCAIDDQVALDVRDDPVINMGPVFNTGRVGIRLMCQTRMTFRNLKVWSRNSGVRIVQ